MFDLFFCKPDMRPDILMLDLTSGFAGKKMKKTEKKKIRMSSG